MQSTNTFFGFPCIINKSAAVFKYFYWLTSASVSSLMVVSHSNSCVFFLQLVLRKWSELIPGGEFRCFVKENKLIGKNCPSSSFTRVLSINICTAFDHVSHRVATNGHKESTLHA